MKHALVKNNTALEFKDFPQGEAPILAANKGQWMPVAELEPPTVTEDETYTQVAYTDDGHYCITYVVRPLTELEKWMFPEYKLKIIAPVQLYNTVQGKDILLWYQLNELPFKKKGDYVHLYCNMIESQHLQYVNELLMAENIEVWQKTDDSIIQIYSIAS